MAFLLRDFRLVCPSSLLDQGVLRTLAALVVLELAGETLGRAHHASLYLVVTTGNLNTTSWVLQSLITSELFGHTLQDGPAQAPRVSR